MIDPCVALYTKATILTSAGPSLCSIVRAFGVLISFGRSTPHQIKNGGEAGTKTTYKGPLYRPGVILRCGGPDLNRPSTTRNYAASSMILLSR